MVFTAGRGEDLQSDGSGGPRREPEARGGGVEATLDISCRRCAETQVEKVTWSQLSAVNLLG